ncbi:hypothetical protein [Capnocytophaga felis]|uniref:Sortilin N-terminal domain-containing protein n=1 Tax=Capnocytophaga felis TaxID=2267611 RepID=A0A5M4B603_9FLAO|nr:hypothetical protein [Capnocytophaga felis]GET45044.1 hypothetical protein RCZ01_03460 [Capnocytophaga felis]GET47792.1 hypothetical protein RCZ02_06230 [Capnocytophaga felis]
MKHLFSVFFTVFSLTLSAQETLPLSIRQKAELKEKSWVKETPFEKIHTADIGNKINTFSVNIYNANEVVIAPNSGGLWHSQNGGETFEFIFENQPTQQINALAIDWKTGVIWVGTPYGLFASLDKGKTWEFKGLASSQNISSITINPKNTEEVVVGVLGNQYNADEKRGIFKTNDGGKTWQHKLFIGTRAGVRQIVATNNSNTLFASVWHSENSYWESKPYGDLSCIYKSNNGGESWSKITQSNGFLNGNFVGKIGLAVYDQNNIYAVVDNRSAKTRNSASKSVDKTTKIHLSDRDFETMSKSDFLNLDNNQLDAFLHNIGLNEKYTAVNLKNMISAEITSPSRLFSFLGVKHQEVVGAEIYFSNDGGTSWKKTHSAPLNDTFYQNGDDFASITVNPTNKNHIFIGGFPLLESVDGGKSWRNKHSISLQNGFYKIHYQSNTLFATTKNGFSISYDNGKNWSLKNAPQSMSFDKIVYDKNKNTFYLAGEQGILMKNNSQWNKILSQSQIISGNKLYVGAENGSFYDFDNNKNVLTPLGSMYFSENKAPLRFGKLTPLLISPQNSDILYAGSNKLHISMDKGKNWRTISEDLTNGDKKGNKPYGTISSIAESPFLFGLIYTGSDDGMIQVSNNGGVSWQMIYNAFPKPLNVNNLVASRHNRNRVIATLKSTDENNREPFIFLSNDLGKTWTEIRSDLPESSINVIKEDPKNEQILYVGTNNGLYVSFNLGESWHPFAKNLPETGILDIFVDENNGEMLVSTEGSGVYKTSVDILQDLRAAIIAQDFYPLQEKVRVPHSPLWGNTWNEWEKPNTPEILFYGFAAKEGLSVSVKIMKGKATLQSFTYKTNKGFNYIPYDLTISDVGKLMYEKSLQRLILTASVDKKYYLPKGKYKVVFNIGDGFEEERELEIY